MENWIKLKKTDQFSAIKKWLEDNRVPFAVSRLTIPYRYTDGADKWLTIYMESKKQINGWTLQIIFNDSEKKEPIKIDIVTANFESSVSFQYLEILIHEDRESIKIVVVDTNGKELSSHELSGKWGGKII